MDLLNFNEFIEFNDFNNKLNFIKSLKEQHVLIEKCDYELNRVGKIICDPNKSVNVNDETSIKKRLKSDEMCIDTRYICNFVYGGYHTHLAHGMGHSSHRAEERGVCKEDVIKTIYPIVPLIVNALKALDSENVKYVGDIKNSNIPIKKIKEINIPNNFSEYDKTIDYSKAIINLNNFPENLVSNAGFKFMESFSDEFLALYKDLFPELIIIRRISKGKYVVIPLSIIIPEYLTNKKNKVAKEYFRNDIFVILKTVMIKNHIKEIGLDNPKTPFIKISII